MINVVAEFRFDKAQQLLERVKDVGRRLSNAQPKELVLGNMVRRTLGLVRDAAGIKSRPAHDSGLDDFNLEASSEGTDERNSLANDVDTNQDVSASNIKEDVLDGLRELLDELDQADKQISEYAPEQIHANEIIMTCSSSITVQKFLLSAAKTRKFTVIHVENYPNEQTQTYETVVKGSRKNESRDRSDLNRLKPLTSAGITVIVVPDSAVALLMPRVNKVIISMQAIFSNGGSIGPAGVRSIVRIAKAFPTPVIALGAVYRLSPVYPYAPDQFIEMGNPGPAVPYHDGELVANVNITNPITDYVHPDLVDLFITNM